MEISLVIYWLKDAAVSLIPILVLLGFYISYKKLNQKTIWKENFQKIFRNKIGKVSSIIILFYVFIFLLASIQFPQFYSVNEIFDQSTQKTENKNEDIDENINNNQKMGGKRIYDKSISLLEWIYSPKKEESYSLPLSKYQQAGRSKIKNEGFHLAGTNINGEDVLLNALLGIRTAFMIGGLTTLFILPIGLLFGMAAGYFGGKTDIGITYFYSTLASIPEILLLIVLMNIFGPGLIQMSIALGITSWIGFCRIIRGETIKLKNMEYIQAAYTVGNSHLRIMFRHILPNLMPIVLIIAVLRFSGLVMAEAVLSYLGIGVGSGTSSWGIMIDQARMELARDPLVWWNITTAFVFMFTLILAVNYFGDVVRDALEPKLKNNNR